MKRKLAAAIGIAGMVVSVAACGSGDGKGSGKESADVRELTVWLTVDAQNNWPELVKTADAAVKKKHPGIKIDHEYYGWPDKNTKLDAVLATDKVPDVVEMGNTEMLGYMVEGAFAPLDTAKFANSAAWLDGLKASVTYDGKIVIVGILAVQMVPLVAMIIPVFLLLNDLGQYDKLTGLIITYLTFILPFTVWTLRGFIVNIPRELEEAAMVDGCSPTGAFLRVVFPLLAPGMVATSVYGFIQAWNDYLYALMLLNQKNQTATVWLGNFTTRHGTEYAPMMAGATMMAVPIVVLFLLVQRKMAAGLTAGTVKG